jgi:hypothetical protein
MHLLHWDVMIGQGMMMLAYSKVRTIAVMTAVAMPLKALALGGGDAGSARSIAVTLSVCLGRS